MCNSYSHGVCTPFSDSPLEVGDKIRNCHNLHGVVRAITSDGRYDVTYNDKQWDKNLHRKVLKRGESAVTLLSCFQLSKRFA